MRSIKTMLFAIFVLLLSGCSVFKKTESSSKRVEDRREVIIKESESTQVKGIKSSVESSIDTSMSVKTSRIVTTKRKKGVIINHKVDLKSLIHDRKTLVLDSVETKLSLLINDFGQLEVQLQSQDEEETKIEDIIEKEKKGRSDNKNESSEDNKVINRDANIRDDSRYKSKDVNKSSDTNDNFIKYLSLTIIIVVILLLVYRYITTKKPL